VWPTYLFVAGSMSLLQCSSMIHKTGANLRNDEIWRLHLLEQIPTFGELDKKTLCRIVEKEISLPDNCCSKDRPEINFQKSHALGAALSCFFQSLHMSICQKASITKWKRLKKHLSKFMLLVSPNDKRFYSYLGTSVGPSPMKILITSYYQKISFRNTVLSEKFQASFFLLIISC